LCIGAGINDLIKIARVSVLESMNDLIKIARVSVLESMNDLIKIARVSVLESMNDLIKIARVSILESMNDLIKNSFRFVVVFCCNFGEWSCQLMQNFFFFSPSQTVLLCCVCQSGRSVPSGQMAT
jgi:hypothetical protein